MVHNTPKLSNNDTPNQIMPSCTLESVCSPTGDHQCVMNKEIELRGSKIVEVPYFAEQLLDTTKSVLIVGERHGGIEGVSETVKCMGFTDVTTTDILPSEPDSWLRTQTNWKHIEADFVEMDESTKYDYIISISVFEHFGFWFAGDRMANGMVGSDLCRWNHDLVGINKACRLLRDTNSRLIITLPAGPYMNYEVTGEPFLRSYDYRRQKIVKDDLLRNGYVVDNESFFYSRDFTDWTEVDVDINDPRNYHLYNVNSPNVIWGLTIREQL